MPVFKGIKLELLDNEAIFSFIEHTIRDGISQISLCYARANNPGMDSGYKSEEPLIHLMYLDANNLYGNLMICSVTKGWIQVVDRRRDRGTRHSIVAHR